MPKNSSPDPVLSAIENLEQSLKSELKKTEKGLRTEIKRGDKALREEILRVEERLENKIDKVDQKLDIKFDKVLTDLSNFAGRVQSLEHENELGSDQISKLGERLTALEPAA